MKGNGEDDLFAQIRDILKHAAVTNEMALSQMNQLGVDPNSPTGDQVRLLLSNDSALGPLVDQTILATARLLAGIGE